MCPRNFDEECPDFEPRHLSITEAYLLEDERLGLPAGTSVLARCGLRMLRYAGGLQVCPPHLNYAAARAAAKPEYERIIARAEAETAEHAAGPMAWATRAACDSDCLSLCCTNPELLCDSCEPESPSVSGELSELD